MALISIRIDDDVLQKVDCKAIQASRSRSNFINKVLEDYLKKNG